MQALATNGLEKKYNKPIFLNEILVILSPKSLDICDSK